MEKKFEKKWLRKVDTENKKVIIDWSVDATTAEERKLEFYTKAGYTIADYSEARANAMRDKADGLNKEKILDALKDDAEATKKFKRLLDDEGFFVAKSWYNFDYLGKERKPKKEPKHKRNKK